ncbi:hypothetical protein GF354_05915 [Candidatus Peregrinibacteria bacterium]|nr:hypothetical protein [Candidatus Peregrinibacteria bacterium]
MKKKFYIFLISFLIIKIPAFAENFLQISEVFPNPKGRDKNEWIEIYNGGSEKIPLKNYTLHINKKPYKIKKDIIVGPKSFGVLKKSDIKFSLNNNKLNLELFDKNQSSVAKLNFNESMEGESYSYTKVISKNLVKYEYFWTSPTPGEKNLNFLQFSGFIKVPLSIANDYYLIVDKTKIIIDKNKHDIALIKNIIQQGDKILILMDENQILQKFKILSKAKIEPGKNNSKLFGILLCLPITVLALILIKLSVPRKPG